MKKFVKEYQAKMGIFTSLKLRREELLKDIYVWKGKLLATKTLLLDTEVAEINFLERAWSRKKIDQALDLAEGGENAWQPNQCAPIDFGSKLTLLRREVDAALSDLYPSKEVREARVATEKLRESLKSIENFIVKIGIELEAIEADLPEAKSACMEAERVVWIENYKKLKEEIRGDTVFPKIRKAFVAVNGYNPYFWRWGNPEFFFNLFPKVTTEEVLKDREKLRKEFFGDNKGD